MKDKLNISHLAINIIKGLLAALITSICISLIMSGIIYNTEDPISYIKIAIIITFFISFITGNMVASFNSYSPLLTTSLYSLSHIMLLIICSIFVPNTNSLFTITAILLTYIGLPIFCFALNFVLKKRRNRRPHLKKHKHLY